MFRGVRIEGLTPVGRATVHVSGMNDTRRLELRSIRQQALFHGRRRLREATHSQ